MENARRENRIKIFRSAEKGIYNNFNRCISMAGGDYIYFATSDDTMAPTLLEKMSDALNRHPTCDIAHCKLRIIDELDRKSECKIWDHFYIVRYFDSLIDMPHIRKAPHDGILHFSGITAYTSLTQLLIRKSLFDRIGVFRPEYGSIADFEWEMRATLMTDTVHIPEYLATWRLHSEQATSDGRIDQARARGKFLQMARQAVRTARGLDPSVLMGFDVRELEYLLQREKMYYEIKTASSLAAKWFVFVKWLFNRPGLAAEMFRFFKSRGSLEGFLSQADFLEYIKGLVQKYGLEKNIVSIG